MDTALQLPRPLPWQRAFLDQDRQEPVSLTVQCVGRRSGKSHLGLLWLAFAPGGLLDGKPVAIGAPTEAHMAEVRQTFKNWFHPLIKGPSPGNLGFELANGGRVDFWSLSPGHNAFRGRGYSLAWIDEAAFVRNLSETIEQNLTPALAQYKGRLLLTSTPRGFNQFHDWFRRAEREGRVVTGPSTLNPNVSPKWLAEQRKTMPEVVYQQEVLAQFVTIDSGLVKRSDIKLGTPPPLDEFLSLSMGLDFALTEKKTGDFSAAVLAGVDRDKQTWILRAEKWRAAWPETFQRVLELYKLFEPHIVVTESVAFSELCVRELTAAGVPIDAIKPSVDKVARMSPIAMRYRLGMIHHSVYLPQDFEDEILMFPNGGEHDDQVDALVYAVGGLDRTIREAWSEGSTGLHWGTRLPHEAKAKILYNNDGVTPLFSDETGPTSETIVAVPGVHQSVAQRKITNEGGTHFVMGFGEKFVGDVLIATAHDGVELMRIERGKSHLYFGAKMAGKLPWQLPGWVPPTKEEA
jgi:predicted phage terminase large subunit-like protein